MLKKTGRILLITCPLLLTLTVVLLFQLDEEDSGFYEGILMGLSILFALAFSLSFTLIYFKDSSEKRRTVIFRLSIIFSFLLVFGFFSKFMHWPGAAVEVIIGVFLFAFGALPLIIRNRYEKRRQELSGTKVFWSFTDLAGVTFICLGALSKFLHWPGSQILFGVGGLTFLVSIIGWNVSFRKEVKLKIEAEEKLRNTLNEVEKKNQIIEEKQKAIIDSIEYAKRIQKAHIPSEKYIRNALDRLMKNK